MAIVMTSGGVSKTYNYYPYDALYVDANGNVNANGNGTQVKEAWFNGVKYYPIGEKPSFRLELRFSNNPHHFDKSDVATYYQIVNNRSYYDNFLNVDENQWIYSTLSITTHNPPRTQWGILTDYSIHKRIVFPNSFGTNNLVQKFAFSINSYYGKPIDNSAQNFSNWPGYNVMGNYDESYYYKNDIVHTTKYYLHNGLIYCYVQPYMNWYKEDGEEVYFSILLNSNRSYEFYVYSNSNDIRLVAEYSGGNLTVYEGYVYAVNMSASDEVSKLLQYTGVSQLPTHNSH